MSYNWDALVAGINGGVSLSSENVVAIRKALQDNLVKAQNVGYQTPVSGGGDIAPLLPQSVDSELATIPYTEKDLVFRKMLPEDMASQTLHEVRVRTSHGDKLLDKNTDEGEITDENKSTYAYRSLRMRYWVEHRILTDVASALQGIGVPAGMLAEATQEAGLELLRSIEMDCLHGNQSFNAFKPDGIIRMIETDIAQGGGGSVVSERIEDFGGNQLSLDYLEYRVAEMVQPNIAADPTHILVSPRVFRDLSIQWNTRYRNSMGSGQAKEFTPGFSALHVLSPRGGEVPIVSVPFLDEQLFLGLAPAAAGGNATTRPATPTVAAGGAGISAAAGGKVSAAEAGAYFYKVVACNPSGYSAPLTMGAVSPVAGQKVVIKVDEVAAGATKPTYFKVFRSDKNGANTTCKFLFSVACPAAGGGLFTFEDTFAVKANTSKALIVRMDKKEMCFYKLLPTARVPLAKTKLIQPFVLFASGAPYVKVPEHQFVLQNVGVANLKPVIGA